MTYLLLGIFAQITSIPESHAAAIWPSAGVALASLLLFGNWILPGIFIGCFGISAWSFNFNSEFIVIYSFMALGAIAGAFSGYFLIKRIPYSSPVLMKKQDIVLFLLFAGPVSSVIPSSINLITIYIAGIITVPDLFKHWFVWWSGNAVGSIVFTPVMLILLAQPRELWANRKVSVALPAVIMYLFLTLFYQFTIKLGFPEEIDLLIKVNLENFNLYFLSILFYGLSFTFIFIAILLIISGQNQRIATIYSSRRIYLFKQKESQKQKLSQLEIGKNKAESANRAKNLFLSHISHELRTPLSGIIGFTQLLQKQQALDIQDREKLNIIQNCSDQLLNLINDILDISKIESGKIEIVSKPFDFKNYLTDLISVFKLKADEKNISFEVNYGTIPEYIESDKKRLRQIFSNLLSNAINFTDQGGVKITINFEQEQLLFSVKDTGRGVSDHDYKKIFDPFVQIKTSDQTVNGSGSGLGLTITLQLLTLLGGSISVTSQLGVGSEFSVRIPLKVSNAFGSLLLEKKPVVGYQGPKKFIWIVDDNEENASLLQIILLELGFIVSIIHDGFECLEKLEKESPDLIIMDMMLPVLNGIETNRSIFEKKPKQKIIGMSASVFAAEQQHFLDSGCLAFIAKPFQHDDLIVALNTALELTWVYASPESIKVDEENNTIQHTVLVAEDNEINCLLLENLLISLKCSVEIAMDGGQALEKLLSRPYNIALIDLQMPVMDGEDVVQKVRNQVGPNQKTKIIAVSGFAEKHKVKSVLKKGFDDYLSKPVDLAKLEDIIKTSIFKSN